MKILSKMVVVLLLFLTPITVFAGNEFASQDVYIAEDEVVDGNLLAAGETIIVDGTVNGDIIVAGGVVIINGVVAGDVIATGGQVKIFGPVQGDLRIAGGSVNIDSVVGKNVTVFGGDVTIGNDAVIGWSLLAFAGNLDYRGEAEKNIRAAVGAARINGRVGGDVYIKAGNSDQFKIGPQTVIGGDLTYSADEIAEFTSGAVINGEVNYQSIREKVSKGFTIFGLGFVTMLLLFGVIKLLSLWILGLLLVWAIPKHLEKSLKILEKRFWPSFGWGLLALIVSPLVIILLFFSFIGFPIALLLMAIYGVATLYGVVLISLYCGERILKKATRRHWRGVSMYWSVIVGIFVFVILTSLPVIGCLIKIFLVATGVGGLLGFGKEAVQAISLVQ